MSVMTDKINDMHTIMKYWEEHGLPQCGSNMARLSAVEKSTAWLKGLAWSGAGALALVGLSAIGGLI